MEDVAAAGTGVWTIGHSLEFGYFLVPDDRATPPNDPANARRLSSRTSPRRCASAWPSGAHPRSCLPFLGSRTSECAGRLREDPRRPPAGGCCTRCCSLSTRASVASSPSVERLAAAVVDGIAVEGFNEELEALRERHDALAVPGQLPALLPLRPLAPWTPKTRDFFDELEETNPAIRPVVERLRAEHRAVVRPSGRRRSSQPKP